MRFVRACAVALAAVGLFAPAASAAILIEIDKSAQTMTVSQDGARLYTWPVSTGQRSYDTPSGSYKPFRMEKDHFSREWDDAPMPHSIFFTTRGHAIHGTEHTRNIGRPASHGCVRLEPENARTLFGLVKQEGMANTRVVLFGTLPAVSAPAVARRAPRYEQLYSEDDDVTGSAARRTPRDTRPLYWGPAAGRPPAYGDAPYRPMPPPPGFYMGPRNGWN